MGPQEALVCADAKAYGASVITNFVSALKVVEEIVEGHGILKI